MQTDSENDDAQSQSIYTSYINKDESNRLVPESISTPIQHEQAIFKREIIGKNER
jgi:hypothetical protein